MNGNKLEGAVKAVVIAAEEQIFSDIGFYLIGHDYLTLYVVGGTDDSFEQNLSLESMLLDVIDDDNPEDMVTSCVKSLRDIANKLEQRINHE